MTTCSTQAAITCENIGSTISRVAAEGVRETCLTKLIEGIGTLAVVLAGGRCTLDPLAEKRLDDPVLIAGVVGKQLIELYFATALQIEGDRKINLLRVRCARAVVTACTPNAEDLVPGIGDRRAELGVARQQLVELFGRVLG